MEQAVFERSFPQNQHDRLHNSVVPSLQQDPSQSLRQNGQNGYNRSYEPNGNFCNDNRAQEKHHRSVCRDFIRGKCMRGASCRYDHSESDEHDRPRGICRDFLHGRCTWGDSCRYRHSEFDRLDGQRTYGNNNVSASEDSGRSQFHEANSNSDLHARPFNRAYRIRSPCRNFQRGLCHHGADCTRPHLYPDKSTSIRPFHEWRMQQPQEMVTSGKIGVIEGNQSNSLRTCRVHEDTNVVNDLRARSSYGDYRRRSPCRNFQRGHCFNGADCPRPHVQPENNANVRPWYDGRMQVAPEMAPRLRDTDTFEGNQNNSVRVTLVHEEARMANDPRACSSSGEYRGRSPCRNFLRGNREASSRFLQNGNSAGGRPQHDRITNPAMMTTFQRSGFHEVDRDMTPKTYQENDEARRCSNVRTRYFLREPRSRSPCRNFSAGRCHLGASCPRVHLVTEDRPMHQTTSSQGQGDCFGLGPDKLRVQVCMRFTQGRCFRGESCKYLHGGFHEYASSVSNWNKQPHLAAARVSNNHCEENHYEEAEHVKRENMQRGEHGCAGKFVSFDGSYSEDPRGQSTNTTVELNNERGERQVSEGHKSDISRELTSQNGDSAEGNQDNMEIHPSKRRRTRSRSPVCHRDEVGFRTLRRYEAHNNFNRGRNDSVAPFHYPHPRPYTYNRPRNHINNQPLSGIPAASASPSFHEDCKNSNLMKGCDEVVSDRMQQDCPSGSFTSGTANLEKICEAESLEEAPQPSHSEFVANGSKGEVLVEETGIKPEVGVSDATNLSGRNGISATGTDSIILKRVDNVDMKTELNHEHKDAEEVERSMRTYVRKRRKRSISDMEVSKGVVTDPSTPGLPSSSGGGNSVTGKGTVAPTISAEDLKSCAAEDSILTKQQVQQREQDNKFSTNEVTSNLALNVAEGESSLVGKSDTLPVLQSPPKVATNLRRKLLVLDLNGILVDIVADVPRGYKPDALISTKAAFKRPFCDDFLKFCFEKFDVGVWSSRTKKNVTTVIDFLMPETKNKLLFCWDQFHCTATGYYTIENRDKPLVLKELKKLWEKQVTNLPWEKGFYNETNTVLLDDSPYKALRNPPFTAIFPYPYSFMDCKDPSLGPGGDLRLYLEKLAVAENVPKFIQENPFGQRAITKSNASWGFYSKIVGAYGSQQEGNASKPPVASEHHVVADIVESTSTKADQQCLVSDGLFSTKSSNVDIPASSG